jgi:hypothetical protein
MKTVLRADAKIAVQNPASSFNRVSYRGANEDLPGYFCLIFDLKKIDFSTAR